MKLKQYLFPLLILIATGLTAFFIYELIHNFDNIFNVTANNNVIVNQINQLSDFTQRDNSNLTANVTTSDTNSTTTVLADDTKSLTQLGWAVGAFAFVVFTSLIVPPLLEHYFGTAARQVAESIEMQSIPERVINS